MNNYFYGFDIGCASVGWSVVDLKTNKIIELGSNIFSEANPEENATRRARRGQRRLLRRRKNRIRDFKVQFWNKHVEPKFDSNKYNEILEFLEKKYNNPVVNIAEIKVKGLKDKLEQAELYYVLLNYCKHKGISYIDDEVNKDMSDENESKLSDYAKGLILNQKELANMYPSQIQLNRLIKVGCYRGENNCVNDGENVTLSNVFTTNSYIKEIRQILNKQKEFYSFINETFIDEFVELFKRKREYYIGPGNEKSRTDYGVYTTKLDENGKYIKDDNIFSKLVGKCSIYNKYNGYKDDEFRASACSYSAELYNLLNDLNNIRINGEQLTESERKTIIIKIKEAEKLGDKNVEKIIGEVSDKKDGVITGARIDKDGNNIYHKFECYRKLKKFLSQSGIDISVIASNEDKYNKIMDILTINTERDAIINSLSESKGLKTKEQDGIELDLSDEVILKLVEFRNKNGALFSKWHSFSYKILKQLIPLMMETGNEQMTCLQKLGVLKHSNKKLSDKAILSKKIITSEIYNPVVVRSTRVSIDILNALIKKYGYPQKVVIEMPRDKNDKEEKDRIKKEQSNNEKELSKILEIINKDYGIKIEIGDKYFKNQKNLTLKLKLWNEQQHKCVYSGKAIDINDLLNNYNMFEIDHIIPLSISFDDSRQNKVLVYRTENQLKGQRTPIEYINSGDSKISITEYLKYTKEIYGNDKNLKKKYQNLTFADDISKKAIRDGFIERNLNDTRYASRIFLNGVSDFFKGKEVSTIVKVIKGSFTHQMRTGLALQKDRDESFAHHAIDASLICFAQMGYDTYYDLQKPYIDTETGEILNVDEFRKKTTEEVYKEALYQKKWKQIKDSLIEAENRVKYWYKPDRKANRKVSDETIYGTRIVNEKTYKINSFNIRANDGGEKFKKYCDKSLMAIHDKKTFEMLVKISKEYSEDKNPFLAYEKDTGNLIRKYAKDGNGAVVSNIKYLDGEVGKCIDISHKYGLNKGSKKIILAQLVPYRTDVYYNKETKKYKFVGVKQNTLKYIKGELCVDVDAYEILLRENGVLNENQTFNSIGRGDWEFRLSFYDNEYIKYEIENKKTGKTEKFEERHHSLNRTNLIETKPIQSKKFNGKQQNFVTVTNAINVQKIVTSILGDRYYISKENFSLKI